MSSNSAIQSNAWVNIQPNGGIEVNIQPNAAIEVPIQPYAGQLLVIKDLIQPKVDSGARASYFERSAIAKKLLKNLALVEGGKIERMSMYGYDSLVEGFLEALEAYMKLVVQKVVELCDHRCGYNLYMNKRFVMKSDVRTTMTFLNDLEMADIGSSDDEGGFYRKTTWLEERRERKNRKERKEPKEQRMSKAPMTQQEQKATNRSLKASADSIAMMAFGTRKRIKVEPASETTPIPSLSHAQPGVPLLPRLKHVTIKDVLQFLEEDKRYCRSNMLYEAYMKYTT